MSPSRLTLDVPEAAARLGVSKRHLYGLIERGEFPAIKLGRRRVVPIVALDEILARATGERAAS